MENKEETTPDIPLETGAALPPDLAPESAPDPEEDDLDDLDDMLDEFSAAKIDDEKNAPLSSGPGRPSVIPDPTDDFAKELQVGMADLLGELETSPDIQQQFEKLVKELGNTAALDPHHGIDPTLPSQAGPSTAADDSFQETIKRTMQRMQESGEQATAAAVTDDTDDILAEMLKQMQSGALEGGGEEDFSKMLLGMMEQLTNKEILYEPMKELKEKFPEWMAKNKENTGKEDLARYEEQQSLVGEIVAKFEEKTYADSNAADREYIVERMQKMQAAGSPPADLVGDMTATQEALGDLDSGCAQQ